MDAECLKKKIYMSKTLKENQKKLKMKKEDKTNNKDKMLKEIQVW